MEKHMNILAETLIRGRDSATRLQNLLCEKGNNNRSVSFDYLVLEIAKSFTEGLSLLNSCGFGEICSPRVGFSCSTDNQSEVITGNSEKIAKEPRGRQKKRKKMESCDKVSNTSEDGYVWRKYGEKEINNSTFPRCYYRCSYKEDQRCMALKQVQQLEGESNKFHIRYIGCHTCTTTPQPIVSHPPVATRPGFLLDFAGFKDTPISPSKKEKVESNKVMSRNDAQPAPILVTDDVSLDDVLLDDYFPDFSEAALHDHGEHSSPSVVSYGLLETNFLEYRAIFVDEDDDDLLNVDSMLAYEDILNDFKTCT